MNRLWFALAHGQQMGRHLAFKVLMAKELADTSNNLWI
jgi:hypothetical protein